MLIESKIKKLLFFRYSKIRELHERMCQHYPSLSRLVFPMKWMFNSSEHNLVLRQMQLENYLKLFVEIMLVDPASPICVTNSNSPSTRPLSVSLSMNSIVLNSHLYEPRALTKSKLCSFCPFFEPTQADLEYAERLRAANEMRKSRSSSVTMSSLDETT